MCAWHCTIWMNYFKAKNYQHHHDGCSSLGRGECYYYSISCFYEFLAEKTTVEQHFSKKRWWWCEELAINASFSHANGIIANNTQLVGSSWLDKPKDAKDSQTVGPLHSHAQLLFLNGIFSSYTICVRVFSTPTLDMPKLIQSLFRGAIAALFDLLQSIDEQ